MNNVLIENVEGYMYLTGTTLQPQGKEPLQDKEIQRRIMAGWAAYAKHRDIFEKQPCHRLSKKRLHGHLTPTSIIQLPTHQHPVGVGLHAQRELSGDLTLTSIITYTYVQPNSNTTTKHQIRQKNVLRSISHVTMSLNSDPKETTQPNTNTPNSNLVSSPSHRPLHIIIVV